MNTTTSVAGPDEIEAPLVAPASDEIAEPRSPRRLRKSQVIAPVVLLFIFIAL